jgi:WD40 repeat protein
VALGDDALVAVVQGFRGHQHVAAFMDPGAKAWRYVPGIHCLGRSPNGQWIAQANQKGIAVSGTDLRTQYWFDYPHGNEGTPERLKLKPAANPKEAEVLVPFNDGKRLLLGNSTGVYLLRANSKQGAMPVKRLHPHSFDEEDYSSGDEIDLAMVHVALSPDGRWIALGSQDSQHILMNAQGKLLAELGPENYPHHAVFDAQSRQVLLNECHFYNGWTRKVNLPTAQPAAPTPMEFSKEMADDDLRVYSSLRHGSRIYLGGAGNVSALNAEGRPQWTQFVGGTIKALDFTPSGDIWVANYSGLLERYRIDPSTPNEARIGTGDWHNVERWIFMADAAHPFAW